MTSERARKAFVLGLSLAAYAVGIGVADALDLRSWDQTIDGGQQRFNVVENFTGEAVLDRETQLVWERVPAAVGSGLAWANALEFCSRRIVAHRMGWRLPSVDE